MKKLIKNFQSNPGSSGPSKSSPLDLQEQIREPRNRFGPKMLRGWSLSPWALKARRLNEELRPPRPEVHDGMQENSPKGRRRLPGQRRVCGSLLVLLRICDGGHGALAFADVADARPLTLHRLLPQRHLQQREQQSEGGDGHKNVWNQRTAPRTSSPCCLRLKRRECSQ